MSIQRFMICHNPEKEKEKSMFYVKVVLNPDKVEEKPELCIRAELSLQS
jgi:hypothetical protein